MVGRGRRLWASIEPTSQQTRHIYPMFVQCWPTVYDAGPTLLKHWVDVSCLLGLEASKSSNSLNGCPASARRLPNAGSMLGRRLRLWPNIEPDGAKVGMSDLSDTKVTNTNTYYVTFVALALRPFLKDE